MLAWMDYWTVLLVLIVALLLFGSRLPEVARSLGRSLNEFKRGLHDVTDEIGREPPPEESERARKKLRPPADEATEETTSERAKEPVDRPEPTKAEKDSE